MHVGGIGPIGTIGAMKWLTDAAQDELDSLFLTSHVETEATPNDPQFEYCENSVTKDITVRLVYPQKIKRRA